MKERYDSAKYNNLTVKQYIQIKLKMIEEAKKNPINSIFGTIEALLTIERVFEGDLAELCRHEIINMEDLK